MPSTGTRLRCLCGPFPQSFLAYKFITFPTSAFQNRFEAGFHYFFAGSFLIGEFHNFTELFSVVAANPEAIRGMDQFRFTGPFYAALGYSFATVIALRLRLPTLRQLFPSRD
jgi:hypothetical protein